jgi:hypothetical protein
MPPEEKNETEKQTKHIFAASAAVLYETGNFPPKTAFEARPIWACRKRSLEGIPVPVRERE